MRKITAAAVLIVIAIIAAGVYMNSLPGGGLSREEFLNKIREKYPHAFINPVFENNCDGLGTPCWKAEFVDNETGSLVFVEETTEGGISEQTQECTEWWCDAPHCDYVVTEQKEDHTVTYYNTGCSSPTQSCNSTHSVCGVCQSKENCIRKTVRDYGTEILYRFEVIGTNAYGTINTTALECKIYDKNQDLIFQNTTSVSDCEMVITYYTKCAYDVCDFIPAYTLIPL